MFICCPFFAFAEARSFAERAAALLQSCWESVCLQLQRITDNATPSTMLLTALIIIVFTGTIGGILAKK